jgi:DNA-binding phage protein
MGVVPRSYVAPNSWLVDGGNWPEGPFRLDTPEYAIAVSRLVQACNVAMLQTGDSLRGVARNAGIDTGSLSRLMSGQTVPDLGTVVALESAMDTDLWPVRALRQATES